MAVVPGHLRKNPGEPHNLVQLLHGLQGATVALNLLWATYMLTTRDQLMLNPVWRAAMNVVPGHEPLVLALAFLAIGLLAGLAAVAHRSLASLGWLAHGLGLATWLMLGGSFLNAALENNGVGAGNVVLSWFVATVHAGLLWARKV